MNDIVSGTDAFLLSAMYYKARISYSDEFFEKLAHALKITRKTKVLDLACGSGEISFGLSRYAGQVAGIDKSHEMLKNAIAKNATGQKIPNVTFYQQDLNQAPVLTETKVDLVTIGRAIGYMDAAILKGTLTRSLKRGCPVIICGAGLGQQTPWVASYQQLRRTVRRKRTHVDFQGIKKMNSIGFSQLGTVGHTINAKYRFDDIMNYALSYSSQTESILQNIESFTAALGSALAPFREADGTFSVSMVSWGHVFRSND